MGDLDILTDSDIEALTDAVLEHAKRRAHEHPAQCGGDAKWM